MYTQLEIPSPYNICCMERVFYVGTELPARIVGREGGMDTVWRGRAGHEIIVNARGGDGHARDGWWGRLWRYCVCATNWMKV